MSALAFSFSFALLVGNLIVRKIELYKCFTKIILCVVGEGVGGMGAWPNGRFVINLFYFFETRKREKWIMYQCFTKSVFLFLLLMGGGVGIPGSWARKKKTHLRPKGSPPKIFFRSYWAVKLKKNGAQ